jgi:predicted  nucleic acid-binding Zn-ribbon protein
MLITSLGTYGFLAKAHLDQSVPSGDIQAQVGLFDEKIATERANIDTARKALTQMDSAVDQLMARTDDDKGASKASNLRRSQARERSGFLNDIQVSQNKIQKLQEQRAPIASKARKVEADVGPIRYVAALIYGDKADSSNLEAAVRWVIIIIVLVFDPLAIVMLLAATTSIDWSRLNRAKKKLEKLEEAKLDAKIEEELEVIHHHHNTDEEVRQKIDEASRKSRELLEAEFEVAIERFMLDENIKTLALAESDATLLKQVLELKEKEQNFNEEELSELLSRLDRKTIDIAELAVTIETIEHEITILSNKNTILQNEIDVLTADYDRLSEEKIKIIADAQLTEAELENIIADLAVEIEKSQSGKDEAESTLAIIREELVDVLAKNEILNTDFTQAKLQITELLLKEDAVMGNADELVATSKELANKLIETEMKLESTQYNLTVLRDERNKTEDQLEESLRFIDEYKNEIATLQKDISGLMTLKETDTFELQKLVAKKDSEIAQLKIEAQNDIENLMVSKETDLTELISIIESKDEEIAQLRTKLENKVVEQPVVVEDTLGEVIPPTASLPVKKAFVIPKLQAMPDNFPMGGHASFGITFPQDPIKGDLYLRVDYMPSKLFKWSGTRWIELDKAMQPEHLAYDDEYVKLLVSRLESGEQSVDDLTDAERENVERFLKEQTNK